MGATHMFQPGAKLLSQRVAPRGLPAPERRLMMAVLEGAIYSIEKYRGAKDPRSQQLFREEKEWLLSQETDWAYSFECICQVLDLDANAVRRSMKVAPASQPIPVNRRSPLANSVSRDR